MLHWGRVFDGHDSGLGAIEERGEWMPDKSDSPVADSLDFALDSSFMSPPNALSNLTGDTDDYSGCNEGFEKASG
jgi:hypothetical protein